MCFNNAALIFIKALRKCFAINSREINMINQVGWEVIVRNVRALESF